MHVEYASGGKIRFSLRNRPLDRDTADVRKKSCAGWTFECKSRENTVGNLSSGQAPITVQGMTSHQTIECLTVKDKVDSHANIDPRFNDGLY